MREALTTTPSHEAPDEWGTEWDTPQQETADVAAVSEPTRRGMGKRMLAKVLRRPERVSFDEARDKMFSGDNSDIMTFRLETQAHENGWAEDAARTGRQAIESRQRLDQSYGDEINRVRTNELLSRADKDARIAELEAYQRGNARQIGDMERTASDQANTQYAKERMDDSMNDLHLSLARDTAFIDRYGNKGADALMAAKAAAQAEIQAELNAQPDEWGEHRSAAELVVTRPMSVAAHLPKRMRSNYLRIHGWIE